jgi:hypothetical protein
MTVLENVRWRNRCFLHEQIYVTDVTSATSTVIRKESVNESLVEWYRRRMVMLRNLVTEMASFHGFGVGELRAAEQPIDVMHQPVVPAGTYDQLPQHLHPDPYSWEPTTRYGRLESTQSGLLRDDKESDMARGLANVRKDVLYRSSDYQQPPERLFARNYGGGGFGGLGLPNAYEQGYPAGQANWDEGSSDGGRFRPKSRGHRGGRNRRY